MTSLGAAIKLGTSGAAAAPGPGVGRFLTAPRGLGGVLPAHRRRALAPAAGTDMRPALGFLLRGLAARFLALGPGAAAPVRSVAVVFRAAGLMQGDGDGLAPALDLAALAARRALELAMSVFMHHTAQRLALPRG